MPSNEMRKRRLVWLTSGALAVSFFVSQTTGVSFFAVFKPFGALLATGMLMGWVAYHVVDFNPYRYGR